MGALRLLPAVFLVAMLMLGVKLGDLWRGGVGAVAGLAVAQAQAQESAGEGEAAAPQGAEAVAPGADAAGADANGKDALRTRLRASIETLIDEELRARIETLIDQELDAALMRRRLGPADFTQAELEVLQSLVKRREELEARQGEIEMQANLLDAAEKRIDDKIAELERLEATMQGLLERYDEEEEAKMKSLVKIYENMKPKDAARIFQELDMEVLLGVAERMREAKMAPILAQMDPSKAKAITVELVTRRPLPEGGG